MPDITNEFQLIPGNNLPNSTHSLNGRGRYVQPVQHPIFRTRQSAYRFIGWLETMVDGLPDEAEPLTLDEVREAIKRGMQ